MSHKFQKHVILPPTPTHLTPLESCRKVFLGINIGQICPDLHRRFRGSDFKVDIKRDYRGDMREHFREYLK